MKLMPRARARLIHAALLGGALVWLGVICAAPWLAARHDYTSALLIYGSFSAICHQLPERSFHLLGYPLAVCARCTGIYAGFLIGLLLYPFARRLEDETMPARGWLIAAAVPTMIDFTGGLVGVFTNTFLTNTFLSRAVTGLIAGAAAAFYILPGVVAIRFRVSRAQFGVEERSSNLTHHNPQLETQLETAWRMTRDGGS